VKLAVERGDLGPVARLLGVQRGDRRLDHVGAGAAQCQRPVEHGAPQVDLARVPARAILIRQKHELPATEASFAPGVVQQHQRQQAVHLGLVRHQLRQRPAQPECLYHQLAAPAIAFVEDQIDDRQHRGEPVGQQMVGRDAKRDARGFDLSLGPHQALGHGGLADQEGTRDLRGGEAAERAQGQRHLGLGGERRMTAGEDELEPLVGKAGLVHRLLRALGRRQQPGLGRQGAIPADAVHRPVPRRDEQPRPGVARHAVAGPPGRGDGKGLLSGLLGDVEVAEEADQGGEHPPPVLAERLVEPAHHSMTGRTSTAPPIRAAGTRAASSMAASRSSASKMK
jgi:hypothetical protein